MRQKINIVNITVYFFLALLLVGCHASRIPEKSDGHISVSLDQPPVSQIPATVKRTPALEIPRLSAPEETYTVVVDNVPTRELLFSMARDASLNLDIDNGINGTVTLNAIDQTLIQILDRIMEILPIRYEFQGSTLRIRADTPYFKTYRVDYLNMERTSKSEVAVSTQISATGQGAVGQANNDGDNNSSTEVNNIGGNHFWKTLTANIERIISHHDQANTVNSTQTHDAKKDKSAGAETSESRVVINKEAGLIAVRATHRHHTLVQHFLDEVMTSATRQVLIEATIAEVSLSDRYQMGIDWSFIKDGDFAAASAGTGNSGTNLVQSLTGANLASAPTFILDIVDKDINGNRLDVTLRALEQFGDVKVMSSPKVMTLNNQTALLKVVDNLVYFSVEVDTTLEEGLKFTEYETTIHTVPVGFVMSVTPYVHDNDSVTLNVRPTISRVIGQALDPNPALADANVISEVPVIQVREVESILKITSGNTAIIGGLMQDDTQELKSGIPVLSSLPWVGDLFSYRDDNFKKTELVIFIRPVVIREASVNRDLKAFQRFLPEHDS